jgi:hypothetical protein
MEVKGYSERGVLNALFYELYYTRNCMKVLLNILNLALFPSCSKIGYNWNDALVLIEQSFSDFGDADIVILLDGYDGEKGIVFIEVKVKAQKSWDICKEYNDFKTGCSSTGGLSSSNLFTQIYFKQGFAIELNKGGLIALQRGIRFPPCTSKPVRKIGNNSVVLDATRIVEPYCNNVWYLSLVPCNKRTAESFLSWLIRQPAPLGFHYWDPSSWGIIVWEELFSFCSRSGLCHTLSVFNFNQGQIF